MPDLLESPHLKLPYLAAAQAQKHVTHNEALKRLDTLVQLAVLDAGLDTPPGTPADGDRYIVAADATGDWEDHDGDVATFVDGAWDFATPEAGWLAYDVAGEALLVHADGAWHSIAGYLGAIDKLGVNATPDDTNRLAVRSAAVLLSAVEAGDGGTGDIRVIVNKEADGDTASLLFQRGSSGRAEVGLAGDTDFVFKVSPDGSAWIEAIRIDKDTGLADILYDNAVSGLAATSVQDAIDEVAASGGAVASVFGRTGTVAAAAGDYDASEVGNDSSVSGASVKDALNAHGTGVAAKQDADGDLAALAGVSATGLLARTGSGTAAARTIAAGAGIAVTNGDGVSGNPTVAGTAATTAAYGDVKLGAEVREKLAANRTYYVRTDGADANAGLANTPGGAFLTVQKAIDVIVATLDVAGFTVTISVGAGTRTVAMAALASPWVGGGMIDIVGDTGTPSNCTYNITSGGGTSMVRVTAPLLGILKVRGFKVTTTTSGFAFWLSAACLVQYGNIDFGACAWGNIALDAYGAAIQAVANYTISGNTPYHFFNVYGSFVEINNITVTLTGTPAFSTGFANTSRLAIAHVEGCTFTGSATGNRYAVSYNAVIYTGGATLPGDSGGTTGTGGVYA